ncbi:MAG TPA: hypothetical protein H9751_05915 [Candidatus Corynebacterium faecigallinarum]|uniref:Transmembrane protein n=1 Tax=Candidatus Corynebacterium faecigallinarum TaxID=2838528 RepID=A0A9D2QGF0_9CORY|nr:hypothetical protein [Candidatus Corynebacterium faecigallinarum]
MTGSISSLILIAVVWLLLLAPLFLRNQSPVRRTSTALSETRVLHAGGDDIERHRKRPLPAESLYHADVDDEIELVDAEPVDVVVDDDSGRPGMLSRLVRRRRHDRSDEVAEELVTMPGIVDGEIVDYRPLDEEDTGEFEPVIADQGNQADRAGRAGRADQVEMSAAMEDAPAEDTVFTAVAEDADADNADAEADYTDADYTDTDADDPVYSDSEDVDAEPDADPGADVAAVLAAVPDVEDDYEVVSDVPEAYIRGGDIVVSASSAPSAVSGGNDADSTSDTPGNQDSDARGELSEEELDYVATRRGRGFYDPVASQHLAEMRQTRRKRVLSVLTALCVVAVVSAVVLGGWMWLAVGATVSLTGAYLYFLRRQVVEEARLHQRRMARMRRARQGVRSTDDRELGVPDRLIRPGAVVLETDDVDPTFVNLDEMDFMGAADGGYDGHSGHDGHDGYGDAGLGPRGHIRAV